MPGFPIERRRVTIPSDDLEAMQEKLRSAEKIQKTLRKIQGEAREARAREKEVAGRLDRLIEDFLLRLDDFERALRSAEARQDYEAIVAGLRTIHDAALHALRVQDVRPFESAGEPFDPARHKAIGDAAPREGDIVAEELRPGYEKGGQVFRKAWVRLAPGPGRAPGADEE